MADALQASLSGIYPRSEEHVEATRGLERQRVTPQECEAVRVEDAKAVVKLQGLSKFALTTDGQLNWQDLFRPFVEACEGLEAGALTRWFDNNTFYRKPVVSGELTLHDGLPHEFFRARVIDGAPWKVVLPGPYTFARAAEETGTKAKRAQHIEQFADFIRLAARWCADRGAKRLQFSEPWLVYEKPPRADLEATEAAYETITKGLKAETVVFPYFGDLAKIYPAVLDLPVNGIGIDLTATDLTELEAHAFDKGALLGAVDGRNSLVETSDEILFQVRQAVDLLEPDWVSIAPSCELELCPRPVADRKVGALGEASARWRDDQ